MGRRCSESLPCSKVCNADDFDFGKVEFSVNASFMDNSFEQASKCYSSACGDAHGILLYMENDYFYFSMHSSSLYSIFMNWLCEGPRLHEYYTSSVQCHTTS